MHYQMLLLAHGAFYKYERRAGYYDNFMKTKKDELWNTSKPPMKEINNLFKFIRRWDHHFRGDKELFLQAYENTFEEMKYLKEKNFIDMDILERNNHVAIQNVINAYSTCNHVARYESTDASKMAHALNPNVFIMWDRRIREGTIGDPNANRAENYAMNFLPRMKNELSDLIASCRDDDDLSDRECVDVLEGICGKKITKLIDQYNYMSYTMPTEYNLYVSEVKKNAPMEVWDKPLSESVEFWREQISKSKYTRSWMNKSFIYYLNELQKRGAITPKERREYFTRWRKASIEDKKWLFDEIERVAERHGIHY